jgi:peptidoglycan/LPS O-acetylase OafA/YrhL
MLLASSVHATVSLGQGRLAAYWLTASLGTAACAFLLARRLPPLPPSLVRLGEMSYTMYLLHIPIGIYLFGKLLPSFGPTSLSEILRQGVVVFSTVILIRPFFLHLERPLLVSPADFTALPVFPVPDE